MCWARITWVLNRNLIVSDAAACATEPALRRAAHVGEDENQRQDGAGHHAVDDELHYLREQRRHQSDQATFSNTNLPPLTLL